MSLLAAIKARLAPPPVPPKCEACKQEVPLEALDGSFYFCPCCAKEFTAVLEDGGDTWRFDLTPRRYRRRG